MGARPTPVRQHWAWALLLGLIALLLLPAQAQAASPEPAPVPSATAEDEAEPTEFVVGTLNNNGEPVEGAAITVEQDGEQVAEGETDERGRFRIGLPEPGQYTVILDVDSLPDGAELRDEDGDRLDVEVGANRRAPVLFRLGESTRSSGGRLDRAPQLLVGGLQFGLVLAMGSIGLSLIFGTTGLTNFAHGELITGGAILAYVLNVTVGMNLIFAALLAVLLGAVFGAGLDRGLWRPLRKRGTGLISMLVVSIGLAFVLRYLYLIYYGGRSNSFGQYATQSPIDVGPVGILPRDMVIMAVTIAILVLVGLGLQHTRFGKATRAVADNPALAASSGIDVERVINIVWFFGAGLAVLGGVFLGLSQQVGYQLGQNILLLLFAAVTLGGLGTAYGALVGAVVIGLFTQLSTLFIAAELQVVGALVVLILVLIFRPQGILGSPERVG